MLKYLFSCVLLASIVSAGVPSYIQVCGRRNPDLSGCVMESIGKLKDVLKKGIPELDAPSTEPIFVDVIPLAELPDFTAIASNCYLHGLSNFVTKSLDIDLEKHTIESEVFFPHIAMEANYDVKAKIIVPIHEKGFINSTVDNVGSKIFMQYTFYQRKGKTYMFFSSMTTKLMITDYKATYVPEETRSESFTEAINNVLDQSRNDIIESMLPNIELAVSKNILEIANRICKHFTYDELFPDRE